MSGTIKRKQIHDGVKPTWLSGRKRNDQNPMAFMAYTRLIVCIEIPRSKLAEHKCMWFNQSTQSRIAGFPCSSGRKMSS